jgi:hypothetical protein
VPATGLRTLHKNGARTEETNSGIKEHARTLINRTRRCSSETIYCLIHVARKEASINSGRNLALNVRAASFGPPQHIYLPSNSSRFTVCLP